MKETNAIVIENLLLKHKKYFATNETKCIDFRVLQLKKLKSAILKHQKAIENALWKDLHKSEEEAYLTEISIVLSEIDYHIKKVKTWGKSKRVPTPIHLLPSSSKIVYEPLGVALIIAPWNYPFQLLINTLVGAISAGCCSLLKPSPDASHTANAMIEMIQSTFDSKYISIVEGGKETNTILFAQRFDVIFFTGSPKLGKIVMKAAAENLIPVILELGGKSPCIVDIDANIDLAAKRIIWGKLINAGQTCIAPDYLFVHEKCKTELVQKLIENIKIMYGETIENNKFYPRIINKNALTRLKGLIENENILFGGSTNENDNYFEPTLIDAISQDSKLMQEEIFGPILPILSFTKLDSVLAYINENEKPLALYYFGKNTNAENVIAKTSSGGVSINDTLMHIGNHNLPFGGVGNSGMGNYHGYESFIAFSNKRAVLKMPTWIDLPFKYPPFKYFKLLKKIL